MSEEQVQQSPYIYYKMTNPSQVWRHHKTLNKYLNRTGKLLVWTKISVPPLGFEDFIPYISGIVEFENGEKMPAQIVDCEESSLKPNLKVVTVIRRGKKVNPSEIIEYIVKVRPAIK